MNAGEFQSHAEKMFPVVPHMGLKVLEFSAHQCILSGSWQQNKNHIGTVFGGSLYCFTALACYGLIWSLLSEYQAMTQNIVISDGHINYDFPVGGDFEVHCQAPAQDDVENFIYGLTKKKKARLLLVAEVHWQGKVCAHFKGTYIARQEDL
jgi:thioesterase domain-containing protein